MPTIVGLAELDGRRTLLARRVERTARHAVVGCVLAFAVVSVDASAGPPPQPAPVQAEAAELFDRPGEEMFEFLALMSPGALLELLAEPSLSPANLSFAAEAAGRASIAPDRIVRALEGLLGHPKGYVREGMVYGLAQLDHPAARRLLERVARHDSDPDVRAVAAEALGP